MTSRDQLVAAIKSSGLSQQAYAREILKREPRSLRRWLAGGKIPQVIIQFLDQGKP